MPISCNVNLFERLAVINLTNNPFIVETVQAINIDFFNQK